MARQYIYRAWLARVQGGKGQTERQLAEVRKQEKAGTQEIRRAYAEEAATMPGANTDIPDRADASVRDGGVANRGLITQKELSIHESTPSGNGS